MVVKICDTQKELFGHRPWETDTNTVKNCE